MFIKNHDTRACMLLHINDMFRNPYKTHPYLKFKPVDHARA